MTQTTKSVNRPRGFAKWILTVAGIVVSFATVGLAPSNSASPPGQVRFGLGWTDSPYFAPLFVAQQNGYYKQANLNVKLRYGSGSVPSLTDTGGGILDLALADTMVGLKTAASGVPVRMVGTYGARSITTYIALEDHGISKPKDLEGKTLGEAPGAVGIVLLPAFANLAGFDAAKVKVLNLQGSVTIPALMQGRIDFMLAYDGGSLQLIEAAARKEGKKLVVLRWRDYGFNALGLAVWANGEFAKQNPDLVQRFLKATYQGVQFTMNNPERAADIYTSVAPTLDKEVTRVTVSSFAKAFEAPSQTQNGLGFIDARDIEATYEIGVRYAQLKPLPDLKSVYTNEFVLASPVFPGK